CRTILSGSLAIGFTIKEFADWLTFSSIQSEFSTSAGSKILRAPRKISPYGVMTGVRVRSAVDRSILGLSSRLPEVAAGFSCWWLDRLNSRNPTRGAPVHLAAAAILSRQTKRRML